MLLGALVAPLAACGIASESAEPAVAKIAVPSPTTMVVGDTTPAPSTTNPIADVMATATTDPGPQLGDEVYDHEGCPEAPRGAVADKANQRYWLCIDGQAVTDVIPMTTASGEYGLPPIGTYEVFARDEDAYGIHGEALERFVAFYTTPKGNRIAFHEVVNQDPDTVGDLDQRGSSAGCFRVREEHSVQVWEFLQLGDPVAVISN